MSSFIEYNNMFDKKFSFGFTTSMPPRLALKSADHPAPVPTINSNLLITDHTANELHQTDPKNET